MLPQLLDLCVDKYAEAVRRFRHKEPGELRWGPRIEYPGVMKLLPSAEVIAMLERFISEKGNQIS